MNNQLRKINSSNQQIHEKNIALRTCQGTAN